MGGDGNGGGSEWDQGISSGLRIRKNVLNVQAGVLC